MKRTLLTSVFAVLALAASAQTEVARLAGEFDFITKNLTADGSIIPYSVVDDGYSSPRKASFTIYDTNFNTVKSFDVAVPTFEYEYDLTTMEAKAPITKKKLINKHDIDSWGDLVTDKDGNVFTINTLEEWKKYVSEKYGEDKVIFTDAEGNFAYHENSDSWSYVEHRGSDFACFQQTYWYYNKEENRIKRCYATLNYYFSNDNLNWEVIETKKIQGSRTGEILATHLRDYDANCAERYTPYLTQGLFNKDDKFELATKAYRKGTNGITGEISSINSGPELVTEDYAIFRKIERNEEIESYISIINEDGKEIAALPDGSYDFEMYKVDGKIYMSAEVYKDGKYQTIIYSVDNVNTGITELARTTPVAAKKFFNTQGMQVDKNAKGIVIQKGGAKYFNK